MSEQQLAPEEQLAVSHLRGLVYHWNEFGPADGLDEKIHYAHEWLQRYDAEQAAPANYCTVPPSGWICTRPPGHDGPCAAHATESLIRDAIRYRFLREDEGTFAVFMPRKHGHIAFGGEGLDEKVDEAIGRAK